GARPPASLVARAQDRGLHHALHHRGRAALRPRARDDAAAGRDRHRHRGGPAAAAPVDHARRWPLRRLHARDPRALPRTRRAARSRARRVKGWAAPVATLSLALVAWQLFVMGVRLPEYLLPAPTQVAAALVADWRYLVLHTAVTLYEIVLGFAIAVGIGI